MASNNSDRAARLQAAVAGFGERSARTAELSALLEDAVAAVAEALPADFAVFWEYAPEAGRLTARAGTGWKDGYVGRFSLPVTGESGAGHALRAGSLLLIEDLAHDERFKESSLLIDHGVRSGALAPVIGPDGPLGVLGAHAREAGRFGPVEGDFLRSLAAVLGGWMAVRVSRDQDAQVEAAVAQVETEIASALETRALLDRLCRLTCTTLGADACETLLLDPDRDRFRVAASFSRRPIDREAIEEVEIPATRMRPLLAAIEAEPLLQPVRGAAVPVPAEAIWALEASAVLFFALRRGGDLFAVQAVGFHATPENGAHRLRVARGIARIASTLLGYARVVDELKRVSQMKSDFVATMSHELRTPLHVIMGYNDLLLEGVLGELTAEQTESLQQSGERTRELLALITATLDLSELESGGMLEDVDVADLVHEIERETRLVAQSPDVELVFGADTALPPLRTDRLRLKVVLENLLDNAVKFTERGRVRLHASRDGAGVQFAVHDTGVGIDSDEIPLIFEPFQGLESVMRKQPGSRRFGLYAVRRLLHMLGGTIRVESEVGRGSTFRVWIPTDVTRQILQNPAGREEDF